MGRSTIGLDGEVLTLSLAKSQAINTLTPYREYWELSFHRLSLQGVRMLSYKVVF